MLKYIKKLVRLLGQKFTQKDTQQEDNTASNGNENMYRIEVERTPFYIVGNKEKGYHIICGKNRLTEEPLKNEYEARNYIKDHMWELIVQVIGIFTPEYLKQIKREEEEKNAKTNFQKDTTGGIAQKFTKI